MMMDARTAGTTTPSLAQQMQQHRKAFPILQQAVNGHPLAYLDNAATTQKPQCVIDAISHYYQSDNANVHRGIHTLSMRATDAYEAARDTIQQFLNAKHRHEIVFTRGTTEAINLVAHSYGLEAVGEGDEVLITEMEHHSNIVPWQQLCERTGATLKVIPFNDRGELLLDQFEALLTPKTKLLAVVHMSNALGTVNPIQQMIAAAHAHNVPVLVDGAQAASHLAVDVQQLDCDFYTLSGHKLFGPTGIGVLYAKEARLNLMRPYQSGGDMIRTVSFDATTFNELPYKFEAGTPNIAGAIGLGAAIEYIHRVGLAAICDYEALLLRYAEDALRDAGGITLIGTANHKSSILSFIVDKVHAHDVGTILDQQGVAIRSGHHCAMPVMQHFGVPATARASIAFYNTHDDIDRLVSSLQYVKKVFG